MINTKVDRYGRSWPYPDNELCPECGQPDSCGDCNHQRLTDEDVLEILGDRCCKCEFCGSDPCQCDRDDNNPVDASADKWYEIYSRPDYDMDHDYSMND